MLQAFLKNDSGTTVIEYSLIAALVSVAILVALTGLGTTINSGYAQVNDSMAIAAGTPIDAVKLEPVVSPDVMVMK